jgi:hypothetical protein
MGMAALTDVVPRDGLGAAISTFYSYLGIAIIGTPLLASRLSVRGSYKAAVAIALLQLGTDQFCLDETLPMNQRKSFQGISNPFELLRLFTTSGKLTLASITMALQNLVDMKITGDRMITLQLAVLQWTRQQTEVFSALIGLGMVFGNKVTEATVATVGKAGHTTFTHLVSFASNLLLGLFPTTPVQFLHAFAGWIGEQRANFVKEMHTAIALETNQLGKGELSGLQANLRALCVAIGPFLYSWAQTRGLENGYPGAVFLVVSLISALAELAHQRLQALVKC